MLNSNSNNTPVSSGPNQGAPALSNTEKKLAESWHAEITLAKMRPEDHLQRYSKEKGGRGALILAYALNLNISSSKVNNARKCTLLYRMTEEAIYNGDPTVRSRARECIKLYLQHGAKINTGGPCPIQLLHLIKFTQEDRKSHEFREILRPYLEYPEIFEIRGDQNASIAHMFAKHSCGCLELILEKKPELLNERQKNGRTVLAVAVENEQTVNALKLITQFKADISLIINNQQRILSTAICLKNLLVVKALLREGTPIKMMKNPLLPDNNEIIMELSKAGFYLFEDNITHDGNGNDPLVNSNKPGPKNCFFTLMSEDKKECEYIRGEQQLSETKIIPSKEQIKRLHLSFLEVMDGIDDQPMELNSCYSLFYNEKVRRLYAEFKKKFPLTEEITFKKPEMPSSDQPDDGPEKLQAYVYTASLDPTKKELLDALDEMAKKVLASPRTTEIKIDELIPIINKFQHTLVLIMPKFLEDIPSHANFKKFFFKIIYRFSTKLVPIFLRLANKNQLDEMSSNLLMITSLASNYQDINRRKSEYKMLEILTLIANTYEKTPGSIPMARTFRLLICINKFEIYAENLLYDALLEVIDTMYSMSDIVLRELTTDSFQRMLYICFSSLLENLKITRPDLQRQLSLVNQINRFISELLRKGASSKTHMNKIIDLCKLKLDAIRTEYHGIVSELKSSTSELLTYGEFNGKYLKLSFNSPESVEIDNKRLRAIIKKIQHIEYISEIPCINLFGLSEDEIKNTVQQLKAISIDEIKALPNDESKPISPSSSSSDEATYPFVTVSELSLKKQNVKKQKNTSPVAQESPSSAAISKNVTLENFERVKIGLRNVLNLRDDAELFPIDHPCFPDSRKHLCFGLWSEIDTKKSGTIPAASIQSHHDLAVTGKVVSYSYGQNGLKPTEIIDARTEKSVTGLKTKKATQDLRINSAPVKVCLPTKEDVLLFVFGVATNHKQDIPKIDPDEIISKSRKRAQDLPQ